MTDLEKAKKIIELVGGFKNIIVVFNCYTRVRINIRDLKLAKIKEIEALDDVIGVVTSGVQIQIIVGPGKSAKLTQVINQSLEANVFIVQEEETIKAQAIQTQTKQIEEEEFKRNKAGFRARLGGKFNATMKKVAGIFVPIIPAFIACGLLLAILEIVKTQIGADTFDAMEVGRILNAISNSVFSILSIIVGYNACKEFGGDGILGACLAGVLTSPFLGDVDNPLIIGPFTLYSGLGGVISVIMVSILAAYFEKLLRKFMPNIIDAFVTPFVTLIVMSAAGLFLLMPLGGWISQGIAIGIGAVAEKTPYLLGVVPAVYLFLVLFGVHHGLIAVSQTLIDKTGVSLIVPVQLMAGAAEVGAAIFVILSTKNKKLKKTVIQALPIGFLGIDEPLIWGMTFPHKRLFFASSIGGALAGAVVGILGIGSVVPETTGIEAALVCNKKWQFALCYLGAIVLGFIFAALIGYKDTIDEVDPITGITHTKSYETSFVKKWIDNKKMKKAEAVSKWLIFVTRNILRALPMWATLLVNNYPPFY